jgi:hypothetical protein
MRVVFSLAPISRLSISKKVLEFLSLVALRLPGVQDCRRFGFLPRLRRLGRAVFSSAPIFEELRLRVSVELLSLGTKHLHTVTCDQSLFRRRSQRSGRAVSAPAVASRPSPSKVAAGYLSLDRAHLVTVHHCVSCQNPCLISSEPPVPRCVTLDATDLARGSLMTGWRERRGKEHIEVIVRFTNANPLSKFPSRIVSRADCVGSRQRKCRE